MWNVNSGKSKVVVWSGVFLLVIGGASWLYPALIIQNHVNALETPSLAANARWAYEGSLAWWVATYWIVFHPACLFASGVGFTFLISVFLYAWHRHRQPGRTVEDEFHEALIAPNDYCLRV